MYTRSLRLIVAAAAATTAAVFAPAAFAGVTATITGGTLAVAGDGADDAFEVICFGGSTIVSTGGAALALPPTPCNAITAISVDAGAGNDNVVVRDVFQNATSYVVHGGDGADMISGAGNQSLFGDAGADTVFVNLEVPGATTQVQASLLEADSVGAFGTDAADRLVVAAAGTTVTRTDPANAAVAPSVVQIAGLAATLAFGEPTLAIAGQAGDDLLDGGATSRPLRFDGGTGSNTITGGSGSDRTDPQPAGASDTVDLRGAEDRYRITGPGAHIAINDSGTAGRDAVELTALSAGPNTIVVHAADVTVNGTEVAAFAGIEALSIDGNAGADRIDTSAATVETGAFGADGADTYVVSRGSTTSIFDSGPTGSDTLVVGGTSGADEVTVNGDLVFGHSPQVVASYNGIETVAVDLGGGGDTYRADFGGRGYQDLAHVQVQDTGTDGVDHLSVPCLVGAVLGAGTITVGTQVVEWSGVEQEPDCVNVDLSLTAHANPAPAGMGAPIVYTASVLSQRAVSGAQLDVAVGGPGVVVDDARASRGTCTIATGTVHCALGTLDGAGIRIVKIVAHTASAGRVSFAGSVAPTSGSDVDSSNDAVMLGADVVGAAPTVVGPQIAFATDRDSDYEVYVTNLDGSAPRNITRLPTDEYFAAWSADETKIAFVVSDPETSASDIWVVRSDGSGLAQLTTSGSAVSPTWSPDGTRIGFSKFDDTTHLRQIYAMDGDGSNVVQLTGVGSNSQPAWGANGRIVFVSSRGGQSSDLWTMNGDGTAQTVLLETPSVFEDAPAVSPNSAVIAYSADSQIWTIHADGTAATGLVSTTTFDSSPAWSPDGSQLAFDSSDTTGTSRLFVVNADGTGLTALNTGAGSAFGARWLRTVPAAVVPPATPVAPAGGSGGGGVVLPAVPVGAVAAIVRAGESGAVSLDTTPAGSSTSSHVTVAWPASAVPAGARVEVLPVSVPVLPGFVAGGAAVDITIRSATGELIKAFDTPLELVFSNVPLGAAIGTSSDGSKWDLIPEIAGPPLPAGQAAGWHRDSSGNVHVLIRHLTRFAVLPRAPEAKLALTVRVPARIDLRVVRSIPVWASATKAGRLDLALVNGKGRVVGRAGRSVTTGTAKLAVQVPRTARPGRYVVRISVTAGSETAVTRRTVVILGHRR
jgi:Tol biopolymer transport system component